MSDQHAFSAALLDTHLPCPPGLCSSNGADPASRFAVYRNNVQSSLGNALGSSFSVVRQLVGEEFFAAMAACYIAHSPPGSPVLSEYGGDFADFIDAFEPAASLPYLADVARLERLRISAYHAEDADPVSNEKISTALGDSEQLPGLRLVLHPSVALLASDHAIVALWQAHQGIGQLAGLNTAKAEIALVLRNQWQVELFSIDPGTQAFIQALLSAEPLGAALTLALHTQADFEPHQALALLIRHNAITQLSPQQARA